MPKKNDRTAKLYKILQDLECELQMLGVCMDFGAPMEPAFAAETLTSCLCFLSKQKNAPQELLLSEARHLINVAIRRENPKEPGVVSAAAMGVADTQNRVSFRQLLDSYRAVFKTPEPEWKPAANKTNEAREAAKAAREENGAAALDSGQ